MLKALLAAIAIAALLFSLGAEINVAEAQILTITIKPDGSIDPSSDAIQRKGNVYVATADLNCSINIQKGDIIVDGVNHTLQGPGSSKNFIAITLMASNITVNNFRISGWRAGVYGAYNNNTITNNVFTDNNQGITIYASDYVVSQNSISGSGTAIMVASGALQPQGDNILIIQNQLANNNWAFDIVNSNGTTITKNNVTDNAIILTLGTQKANINLFGFHMLYFNNFVNNTKVLHIPFGGPFVSGFVPISPAGSWDNGTVGNYWGDYLSKYPNASEIGHLGIGDTSYLIEDTTTWSSDYANGTHLEGTAVLGIAIDHYPLIAPYNDSNGAPLQYLSPSPSTSPTPILSPSNSPTQQPTPEPTQTASSTPSVHDSDVSNLSTIIGVILVTVVAVALGALFYFKKRK